MSEESSVIKVENKVDIGPLFQKSFAKETDTRGLNIIGDAVCFNQSNLAQYYFLLSQMHKDLKEYYKSDSMDKEHLLKLYDELVKYSCNTFKRTAIRNFQYITKYFQGRSTEEPRFCLKLIKGDNVYTHSRDRSAIEYRKESLKLGNTAFQKICYGAPYYFSNDIPQEARNGNYSNDRLIDKDDFNLKSYKEPCFSSKLFQIAQIPVNTNWQKCWKSINNSQDLPSEICFKSTLVIPLSIKRIDLDERFLKHFETANDSETDRVVFGFLCFDHQNTKYFIKDLDLRLGYIFADILSLHYIACLTYTDYSKIYQQVTIELNKNV